MIAVHGRQIMYVEFTLKVIAEGVGRIDAVDPLEAGLEEEATAVLRETAEVIEAGLTAGQRGARRFRRLGAVYMLLGDESLAREAFDRAIESAECPVRAMLLTNPSNPLGQVHSRGEVRAVVEWAERRQIHLVALTGAS